MRACRTRIFLCIWMTTEGAAIVPNQLRVWKRLAINLRTGERTMSDTRSHYPLNEAFYEGLVQRQPTFAHIESHIVPAGGYGFTLDRGRTFRLVMAEGPQIIDLDIFNRDDVTEHYAAGAQFHIEGTLVTRFTRIWGT